MQSFQSLPLFIQSLGDVDHFHGWLGGWRDLSLCIMADGTIQVHMMQIFCKTFALQNNRRRLEGINATLGNPGAVYAKSVHPHVLHSGLHHHSESASTLPIKGQLPASPSMPTHLLRNLRGVLNHILEQGCKHALPLLEVLIEHSPDFAQQVGRHGWAV